MERPVSRRRHRAVRVDEQQENEANTPTLMNSTEKPLANGTDGSARGIWGYIIAILVVIGAAFTLLAQGVQIPLLQSNNHHEVSSIAVDEPTRLQDLHPEDHVYRPPKTIEFNWTVSSGMRRPDGVVKKVYLINGVLPLKSISRRSNLMCIRPLPGPDNRGKIRR